MLLRKKMLVGAFAEMTALSLCGLMFLNACGGVRDTGPGAARRTVTPPAPTTTFYVSDSDGNSIAGSAALGSDGVTVSGTLTGTDSSGNVSTASASTDTSTGSLSSRVDQSGNLFVDLKESDGTVNTAQIFGGTYDSENDVLTLQMGSAGDSSSAVAITYANAGLQSMFADTKTTTTSSAKINLDSANAADIIKKLIDLCAKNPACLAALRQLLMFILRMFPWLILACLVASLATLVYCLAKGWPISGWAWCAFKCAPPPPPPGGGGAGGGGGGGACAKGSWSSPGMTACATAE